MDIITYHPNDWGGENIALSKGINKYTKHNCRCITDKIHPFHYDNDIVMEQLNDEEMSDVYKLIFEADFFHISSIIPNYIEPFISPDNHLLQFRGGDLRGCKGTELFNEQMKKYKWTVTGKGDWSLGRCCVQPVTHIPNFIIDCEEWKPLPKKDNEKILIFHSPTSSHVKGTLYINQAVEKLKEKYDVEYTHTYCDKTGRRGKPMAWREVMKLKQQSDISIDQLRIGALGKNYVESCSVGTPCLGYMNDYWLSHFPDTPVVNTNINNIYEKLEMLILDDKLRRDIGKKSRRFCLKTHHAKVVCKQYTHLYDFIKNPDTEYIDDYLSAGITDYWAKAGYKQTPRYKEIYDWKQQHCGDKK